MNRTLMVVAALIALGAGVAVQLLLGGGGAEQSPTPADTSASRKAVSLSFDAPDGWRSRWEKLGLKGALDQQPGDTDAALKSAAQNAKDVTGVASLLAGFVDKRALVALPKTQTRRHSVRSATELLQQLSSGAAKPVHEVEVAWLARSLLRTLGVKAEFVTDGGGLQTPVLLSRTRVGVRAAGKLIVPLGEPIAEAVVVDDAVVAAWWMIQSAYVKRASQQYAAAHALLAAAADFGSADAQGDFARGVVELDQGLIDRGLDRCSKALATVDDPMARLFLADVLNQLQRPFKAWQQVDQALRKHPDLAEAHASKGIIEVSRVATLPEKDKPAKLDEAAAALRKALQLDAAVPGARAGLAQVMLLKGSEQEAEKLLVEAIDKHRDAAAAAMLGQLWATQDKADDLLKKLAPLAGDGDLRVVVALASAHAAKGDIAGALQAAQEAFKANPQDPQLGLLRADLLRQNGKTDEAIAALDKLRASSTDSQVALLQAQLLLQNQRTVQAIELLQPLSKKPPVAKETWMLLLMAYKQAGKSTEAEALIAKVVQRGIMQPFEVAAMLIQSGDADGATTILEKAASVTRPSVEVVQMLAMIYTAAGRRKDAEALRDRVVANAGERAESLKATMNEAIEGAAAELKAMDEQEGGQAAPVAKP